MSDFSQRITELDPEQRALLELRLKQPDGTFHTFPLSFAQERLWFLEQLEPESARYTLPTMVRLDGQIDLAALKHALHQLGQRHESLRTTFMAVEGRPVQVVGSLAALTLDVIDLRERAQDRVAAAMHRVDDELQRPFDLANGPLLRATLFRLANQEQLLLVCMHHIVSDGWSMGVLIRELIAYYQASRVGEVAQLAALPIQYPDYTVWQRKRLQGKLMERQLAYWRQQLAGAPPLLDLPTDRPRPLVKTAAGATYSWSIPQPLAAALNDLAQRERATLFMTLLAAFKVVLGRYSNQEDVVVGVPVAGRTRPDLEGLIGFFVNTLAVRGSLAGNPPFRTFLRRVRETTLEAYAHQDLPFEKVVEALQPERDLAYTPLFQTVFVLQNAPRPMLELPGLTIASVPLSGQTAKFDLSLTMHETATAIDGLFEYSSDLFDAATIAALAIHFETLLAGIVADPNQRVADLPLMSAAEHQQVLVSWNDLYLPPPSAQTFHALFEAQVAHAPDAIALRYIAEHGAHSDDQQWSYAELNRRANQLARHLRTQGVGPETRVGICMERAPELIVAVLGVLKAGGAYVPLDPFNPAERLAFMLQDAQLTALITQAHLAHVLPDVSLPTIYIDTDWSVIAQHSDQNSDNNAHSDTIAYLIYTSGSTGKPKAVAVPHRGLCNLAEAQLQVYNTRADDRVLQFASLNFDASICEIVTALRSGAMLCLASKSTLLPGPALARLLREHAITIAVLPPTALAALPVEHFPALRMLVTAGEACPPELVARWANGRQFLNAYGPTETTVWATAALCSAADALPPPIGRPIGNVQVFVLDQHMQPVPAGVPGELYIGGPSVARGYVGRPDITAERFVPNPFGMQPGARLYRTGDLGRYRRDGQIEFLRRVDQQVKLRGFRIEPGEIEASLRQHPAVREAVVVMRKDVTNDPRLVAYVVCHADRPSPEFAALALEQPAHVTPNLIAELRDFLKQRLPDYMVPAAWVVLDALPLSLSGKIDHHALPAPVAARVTAPGQAPQTKLEQTIAAIWRELLHVDNVGREDTFFDLGGHSLLMVQAQYQLATALQREIAIVDLFRYPTLRALALFLSDTAQPTSDALPLREARALRRRALLNGDNAANAAPAAANTEIAVVGMSGRFPGAPDINTFWQNLCAGVESISFFSDAELLEAGVSRATLDQPNYVRAVGALGDVDRFDAAFFGYSPREAEIMDPQQRMFLECAWAALEHAGYAPDGIAVPVGVYAGVSLNRYWLNLASNPDAVAALGSFHTAMSNDRDFLTTRISYKLNLRGPSINLQTACSTSLVAIHTACQALLHYECDMALAGGVSVAVPTKNGYLYQEGGIQSPDGHCRAFDARAQGTVGGSGMGVVIVKRLADALADGDTVYTVIRGSALNNDGAHKVGYTAPSIAGQAEVIAEALAVAGVAPDTISYVEAHGTGTPLGDPIEVAALSQAYCASTDKPHACALGSVKTNIGHLDAAAGVAGFIKTTLALMHRQIPPSLHFETPNPQIDFAHGPFFVNTQLAEWHADNGPRRAAVSSFGIGGTNAHVVLEEAPPTEPSVAGRPWQLLLLSAKSDAALEAATTNLFAYLRQHSELNLADVAYTLQVGRSALSHRRVFVCRDHAGAVAALEARDSHLLLTAHHTDQARSIVFMFPGGGGQHIHMAHELYTNEPVFRSALDRCAELLLPHLKLDLRDVLFPGTDHAAATQRLRQTDLALPALFVIEYALAQLWMAWGVQPQALIGHSLGEYVAACLAGVFTLDDALALVATRGRLMEQLAAGAMLSVPLSEADLRARIDPRCSIAAVNAPAVCVVSGPAQAIIELEHELHAEAIDCRRIPIDVAAHSALVEPILEEFGQCVQTLQLQPPRIPCISGVTGTWLADAEATDPRYWVRHLRQTVRFADGVAELLETDGRILLEVGPGQTLSSMARLQARANQGFAVLASLPSRHDQQTDMAFLLATLGRLWMAGVKVDWAGFHAVARRKRVALPTYPFERQRYWIDPQPAARVGGLSALLGAQSDPHDWLYAPTWKRALPQRRIQPGLAQQPHRWLICMDAYGVGEHLARRLTHAGHAVVTVASGECFSKQAPNRYTIALEQPNDYERLFAALQQEQLPERIVHLWGLSTEQTASNDIEAFEHAQVRGLNSVLRLAQALGKGERAEPLRLGVVSNHMYSILGNEQIVPAQTTVLGACKVIPQEYPQITCRSLDVVLDHNTVSTSALIDQIIAELTVEAASGEVAYRGQHRWLPMFEPVPKQSTDATRLRAHGVYLITGGLGGVGMLLAEYLAHHYQAKLILTGRSALPARADWADWLATHPADDFTSSVIARIQQWEALGTEVLALSADVADLDQMHAAVAQAEQHFGAIRGVIHAAGVPGGGMIQHTQPADVAQAMAPKIRGALILERVFENKPLDFLVLCSSLNALVGGFGMVDYCAANIFLDAFAQRKHSVASSQYTVSINWERWNNVGMAVRQRLPSALHKPEQSSRGMEATQAVQLFERIASQGELPQFVVSIAEPHALREQYQQLTRIAIVQALEQMQAIPTDALPSAHARRNLPTAYVAPTTALEHQITLIVERLLGTAPIGIHDSFFELGGHSLLAIQLVAQLRAEFQTEVSLHTLFESPTIAQIAAHINANSAHNDQDATLEDMLNLVEDLSDDEVAALLLEHMPEGNASL